MICTAHNHVQLDEHVSEIIYYTMLGISYIVIHINIISIMGPGAAAAVGPVAAAVGPGGAGPPEQ